MNKNIKYLNNPINKFKYVYKYVTKVYIIHIIFILYLSCPVRREDIHLLCLLHVYQKLSCICICPQNNDYKFKRVEIL